MATAAFRDQPSTSPGLIGSSSALLACGILAGPLYMGVGLLQIAFRDGFNPMRHTLSLMSLGGAGWVQIANFILAGLLVVAGAAGARRAMPSGRGRTWGPLLLAAYGLGVVASGVFVADPMNGFPPGTPDGPPETMSWHGGLHFMAGGVGFLTIIAATFVFALRYATLGMRGWSAYSAATGALFLASFMGVASGSQHPAVFLAFWIAMALIWAWITAISVQLLKSHHPAP